MSTIMGNRFRRNFQTSFSCISKSSLLSQFVILSVLFMLFQQNNAQVSSLPMYSNLLPTYNFTINLSNCKSQASDLYSVIYCDQRYFQFRHSDPYSTFEAPVNNLRITSIKQVNSSPDLLQVMHTTFMAGNMSYNYATGLINPPNIIIQNSLSPQYMFTELQIDDFMILNSGDVGVIKFQNGSFNIFKLPADTPSVLYQGGLKNFPGYLCYQFDYYNKVIFIGNGTDIMNYTLKVDRSYNFGSIIATSFQNNTTLFPSRVNHTFFRFLSDRYLVVVCNYCKNYLGTIIVYDYKSPLQLVPDQSTGIPIIPNYTTIDPNSNVTPNATFLTVDQVWAKVLHSQKVFEITGSTSEGIFQIGERMFVEEIQPVFDVASTLGVNNIVQRHLRIIYSARPQINSTLSRDFYTMQIIVSTLNGTASSRFDTVMKGLDAKLFNGTSFANGKLILPTFTPDINNYLQVKFVQQCTPDSYFAPDTGFCYKCPPGSGTLFPQQTSLLCYPCGDMILTADPFIKALSFQVCPNPYAVPPSAPIVVSAPPALNISTDSGLNVTTPGIPSNTLSAMEQESGLTDGEKIGISVGICVPIGLILIVVAVYVGWKYYWSKDNGGSKNEKDEDQEKGKQKEVYQQKQKNRQNKSNRDAKYKSNLSQDQIHSNFEQKQRSSIPKKQVIKDLPDQINFQSDYDDQNDYPNYQIDENDIQLTHQLQLQQQQQQPEILETDAHLITNISNQQKQYLSKRARRFVEPAEAHQSENVSEIVVPSKNIGGLTKGITSTASNLNKESFATIPTPKFQLRGDGDFNSQPRENTFNSSTSSANDRYNQENQIQDDHQNKESVNAKALPGHSATKSKDLNFETGASPINNQNKSALSTFQVSGDQPNKLAGKSPQILGLVSDFMPTDQTDILPPNKKQKGPKSPRNKDYNQILTELETARQFNEDDSLKKIALDSDTPRLKKEGETLGKSKMQSQKNQKDSSISMQQSDLSDHDSGYSGDDKYDKIMGVEESDAKRK